MSFVENFFDNIISFFKMILFVGVAAVVIFIFILIFFIVMSLKRNGRWPAAMRRKKVLEGSRSDQGASPATYPHKPDFYASAAAQSRDGRSRNDDTYRESSPSTSSDSSYSGDRSSSGADGGVND